MTKLQRKIHFPSRMIKRRKLLATKKWITLLKECQIFGCDKALRLNPQVKITSRALRRRLSLYKKELAEGVSEDQMRSIRDGRSVKHQTFTPEEEKQFADHIRNLMESKIEVVDKPWIKENAIKFYLKIHRQHRNTRSSTDVIPFRASDGWVDNFKARNNFNKSIPKVVQRLSATKRGIYVDVDQLQFEVCVQVMEAIDKYGLDCVLNFDETPAAVIEKPRTCWGDGSKNRMKILSDANPKTSITILPTVTASGDRLPLGWIAKGKTVDCLRKILNIPKEMYSYFSPSGWINDEIFVNYINDVIRPYLNGRKGALLLDSYGAHWTEKVLETANKIGLEFILVPKGLTSLCQPLDISFNGPFKIARTHLWIKERSNGILCTDNVERTVIRSYKAFMSVADKLISKGFADICPPYSDEIMHRYRPRHDGA